MSDETWLGHGALVGEAGLVPAEGGSYPVEYTAKDEDAETQVVLRLAEPETDESDSVPPMAPRRLRQTVELTVTADADRAVQVASEALGYLASAISFLSRRPLEWNVGVLKNQSGTETLFPVVRSFVRRTPVNVPSGACNTLFHAIGQADEPERVIRSIRWLARSRVAGDEVEEFAVLAMAIESLVSMLPTPPATEHEKSAGSSARIAHFAVAVAEIASTEDWKNVGRLRHGLFHGGLTEDEATLTDLSGAIPVLREAVVAAIRHVLGLPAGFPPEDPFDRLGVRPLPVQFRRGPDADTEADKPDP